ncbi:flagellar motor protein [Thermoanaerobacterium sp. RBIITD]|uniref:flagellar motor protein n=1 Tax=Thermoanaerobacterium sp. RBIITD TaxID=1550240 RepID=UPI000BB71EBB|nr:flagellar motor protein [Thermoanaerobacterium sp. RBIITD]SNX55512.1 chemotaxis protein MotA [Thermoanaerobacterium sp. RBIITD]
MDLATVAGVIAGVSLIVWAIFMNGNIMTFVDLPSALITIGGTFASTLISYPMYKIIDSFKAFGKVFFERKYDPNTEIKKIIDLANIARREGLLSLEDAVRNVDDEFLKKGILLVVDGTDPELVRDILETEISFLEDRHKQGQGVFQAMGAYAPAFGMIGTLIGLINMLKNLDDPKKVGPGMAVALITTFYGSILAYLVFLPMARKLNARSQQEVLLKEVMIEGILSIQAGENPRIIEEKLKAFLAPKHRKPIQHRTGDINA